MDGNKKMLFCLVFTVTISTYLSSEVAATALIQCGEMPDKMLECIGSPRMIYSAAGNNCKNTTSECDKFTCIFNNNGWLNNGKVVKEKIRAFYIQYGIQNLMWNNAVQRANRNCLSFDLPPQGSQLHCPAYDVMICFFSSFIKAALPSQWVKTTLCQYLQQYAAKCPMCPKDCFGSLVPYNSCNSCLELPPMK